MVKWLAVVACGQAISDLTFFSNRLAFCVSPLLRVFVWSNTDLERYSSTANHYDYRWGKTRVRRMDYEIPYCECECEWILVLPIAPFRLVKGARRNSHRWTNDTRSFSLHLQSRLGLLAVLYWPRVVAVIDTGKSGENNQAKYH